MIAGDPTETLRAAAYAEQTSTPMDRAVRAAVVAELRALYASHAEANHDRMHLAAQAVSVLPRTAHHIIFMAEHQRGLRS